jgi:hypothetical protein
METVIIKAKIEKRKKTEFLQTMESLKDLIQNHCCEFEMKLNSKNLLIQIIFENEDDLKNKFSRPEFHILKGALISLCDDVTLNINDIRVNNGLASLNQ